MLTDKIIKQVDRPPKPDGGDKTRTKNFSRHPRTADRRPLRPGTVSALTSRTGSLRHKPDMVVGLAVGICIELLFLFSKPVFKGGRVGVEDIFLYIFFG